MAPSQPLSRHAQHVHPLHVVRERDQTPFSIDPVEPTHTELAKPHDVLDHADGGLNGCLPERVERTARR